MKYKNIIFDLGGVVIDLDFQKMCDQFENLGVKNFNQYYNLIQQSNLFEELELGEVSPEEFCDKFREKTSVNLTNEQIEQSWNLMLKNFVPERMNRLKALSKDYNLYLFSNTNAIHVECFEQKCLEETGDAIQSYFKSIFYSNTLHLRKPDVSAFQEVIRLSKVNPEETLFIDDNLDNIKGARAAGLQAHHLKSDEDIKNLDFEA